MVYPASSDANADRRTKDGDKASKVIPDDSAIHLEAWAHQNTNANASKSWKEKPINLIPDSPPFKPVPGNGVQFSDLSKNLDETFKKIDKDKNGFVTHDELRIATADHSYKGDAAMTVALLKANQAGPSRNSIGWLNPDPQSDSPLKGISPKDAKLYFDMLSLAQKEKISNFRLFNKYESQLSSIEFYKLIDPNRDSKITIKELQDASKAKDLPTERKELVDLLLRNHSFLSTPSGCHVQWASGQYTKITNRHMNNT